MAADIGRHMILTSKDPLACIELYLHAGFLRPVEDFIRDEGVWLSNLAGDEKRRLQGITDKTRALQDLEKRHGMGSAIDLDHPFTSKALRINRTRPFLPESAIANAQRYRASQRQMSSTEGSAH